LTKIDSDGYGIGIIIALTQSARKKKSSNFLQTLNF